MGKLTALQVKNAKPGRHADGKGLYLLVKPSGAKSWVLRAQANGRRHDFGLGPTDLVSLQEARDKALEGRKMLRAGFNPAAEWKRTRVVVPTFEEAARRYHENVKRGWKNGKHGAQWLATLEAHAFPLIGKRPVTEIDAPAIQSVLLPIWLEIPETARRVRQRIGAVLDHAHGQGWRATEAPLRAVSKGMPKQPRKDGHFAALPYAELPKLMQRLREGDASVGRLALQFTILTVARSGEVRGATWDEISLEAAQWTIPAARMKGGKAHTVPLSEPAITILRQRQLLSTGRKGELIFPGLKDRPLSDATMAKVLRLAGGGDATVHGMRSAFRDWVAEQTSFPGEWAEAALAHTLPNKVEAAYRRTEFVEQRRSQLMPAWAKFVQGEVCNVIALAERRA